MQGRAHKATFQIPARLFRIGDLVRYTAFSRQTIHNYTTMGLITEAEWTEGGHRLYDESAFERLARIRQLKQTKTLTEITEILKKEGKRHRTWASASVARRKTKHPKDRPCPSKRSRRT